MTNAVTISEASARCREVVSAVAKVVVGKDDVLRTILTAVLADGHILIEDVPGVAKTLIAQSFSRVLGLDFHRIQFVPDLLPGDITGGVVYDTHLQDFVFRRGPIFTNLLLADEVNRGTPKTQAALLEAMQERQVTVDGRSVKLDQPFLVIATQNPIEFEGTYPLPEAQVDRFIARVRIGYPSAEAEREILSRRQERGTDDLDLPVVLEKGEFLALSETVETVYVDPDIQGYIVELVRATRENRRVHLGASPRGTLALFKLARAHAMISGRDYVIPEDVKAMAVPALAHRIVLRPEFWMDRVTGEDIVAEVLEQVPAPRTGERKYAV